MINYLSRIYAKLHGDLLLAQTLQNLGKFLNYGIGVHVSLTNKNVSDVTA